MASFISRLGTWVRKGSAPITETTALVTSTTLTTSPTLTTKG